MKDLILNKKVFHSFEIFDEYDAGVILEGWEVKSILNGNCSLGEGFVSIINNEAFLQNVYVANDAKFDLFEKRKDERRLRKLLLNKHELRKIKKKVDEKGFTSVPLKIFYSDTKKIKLKIGVARGKNNHDKRNDLKQKQLKRDIERELK